jgi:farnesyl-diphosphate farnesyltransferase
MGHAKGLSFPETRSAPTGPGISRDDVRFHESMLEGVSRTFALTIPQLPDRLRETVANAYLLCRIADTIEDDAVLDSDTKDRFHASFLAALESGRGVETFASECSARLGPDTLAAERQLISQCRRVIRVTHNLDHRQRRAIERCVSVMSSGMADFERRRSSNGLADVAELERYCYYVAGVVGEMLTDLFCHHSPLIDRSRSFLEARAVSFGIGLQMTNIIKDVWDDLERGTCWLPRDVFRRHGYDLHRLSTDHHGRDAAFETSIRQLIGIAHAHLRQALDYTLAIPNRETGIRRFLIWAILLAVDTLGKISRTPLFTRGDQVKVSRRRVAAIIAASNSTIRSDFGLTTLFNTAARGLPLHDGNRPPGAAEEKRIEP